MIREGAAKKVTIYVGEQVRHHGEPLYLALLNFLFHEAISGATVIKGVAGFGADHRIHTARIFEPSEKLPIRIEFIESEARVNELLPKLLPMAHDALVEIQDTTVVKLPAPPSP